MRATRSSRTPALLRLVAAALLCSLLAGAGSAAAADRRALLLLPVATGSPGQEWSAKALGGILEDGFGSLPAVRLVEGTARELALRELAASATVTPEAFAEICRRAGADLAVLGGSTLAGDRLALEVRIFDVGAGRELPSFRGDEPVTRAFNLVEAAVRHVAAEAALGGADAIFPRGTTVSLEAYAAYRAALLEEVPAARIEKLRAVVKLDANYADPAQRLGVDLFRQASLDEALVFLERAVALSPKTAEARNNYGVALAAAGRAELAQRQFEEAVALAPDYAEARLNLARLLEERGRLSDAEQQYTAVLEADAGNDKGRAGLAALYDRTNRPELAIREYRMLSARRPDLAEAEFIRVGQEARKAREYARAEKFFLRAADINPQYAQAWAELGTNSYLAGEYLKGVEYFRKALTIDPGQGAYHYYLGLALDKGRQPDGALQEYRRAVELGGPPESRLGLARAALDAGDPGLAVEELNRLLVAIPDNAEAKVLLAQATGEMEARRRLVEGQSQFANQRLARLEQIVADATRANRELEARLQALSQEKRLLERQTQGGGGAGQAGPAPAAVPATASGRDIERLQEELAAERDARRREGDDAQAALAELRVDKERAGREHSEERRRLQSETDELRQRLAGLQAELAAGEAARVELSKQANGAAELKGLLLAAQAGVAKAEEGQRAERERGEQAVAAEREARRVEVEKLRAELAAGLLPRQEKERLLQELAAAKSQAAAAQAAREKAVAALSAESAQAAARLAALEARLKTQSDTLAAREAELEAARVRERAGAADLAKARTDLARLTERLAALEAGAAAQAKEQRERERALEGARQAVRDLGLELGRGALHAQSWERARVFLEQAAAADPRSGEAWLGLGEAYFQLGQYEKSKQMYDKAKQIY